MSVEGWSWRLVLGTGGGLGPADGPTNMAVDSALLAAVKRGAPPVLRLYRWSPATLSFGRNQPARGRYDEEGARELGIDFVRRPTGGQAVLHDEELTYAVVAPVAVVGRPRAAYGRINEALVRGLRHLGVSAVLAGAGVATDTGDRRGAGAPETDEAGPAAGSRVAGRDWDAACFRRPQRGEVMADGAKLVGSAQRMEDRTILQHGSILIGGTQGLAEALLLAPAGVASPGPAPVPTSSTGADRTGDPGPASRFDPGWTTLERALDRRPGLDELAGAIRSGFGDVLGVEPEAGRLTADETGLLEELVSHYRSEEWTWRR